MAQLIMAVLSVLGLSALCSGTEAALFSVSIIKVRQMAQTGSPSAKALLKIREDMSRPIATIVIFNNIANIVGTIVVGAIASNIFDDFWMGVFSAVLTFMVILFSEIIPKTYGERYADTISPWLARPVLGLTWLLFPVLWLLERLISMLPGSDREENFTTNESEIKLLAKLGHKEGIIEQDESEMIQRVFELNDLTAADLLTPRVVMTSLNSDSTLEEIREKILKSPHSRIVVIGENLDDIQGVALKSELLKALIQGQGSRYVNEFLHQVRFVPRQMKADDLLLSFRHSRQHLAIVLDEFGGVAGLVTLEDVVEVLTGTIMDETDAVENLQEEARQRLARAKLKPRRKPVP